MFHLPIAEINPLSLINFTGKPACTVFTIGCNLRCRYCYNRSLVLNIAKPLAFYDITTQLSKTPIRNITITGGEPLLHSDILDFVLFLKNKGYKVKLDTNGTSPKNLFKLLDEKIVDYVAVDIKGFSDGDFKYITRSNYSTKYTKDTVNLLIHFKIPFELRYTVWKIPEKEDLKNFFLDINCSSPLNIYLQKIIGLDNFLDKSFKVDLDIFDLKKTVMELSKFGVVSIRNA